jgi:hypothetical protein
MQRGEIDGVALVWTTDPGPFRGSLTFGCGLRDETFDTLGLTHQVQRLVMGGVAAPPAVETDAATHLAVTTFTATGDPDGVAGFLSGVCAALGTLTNPASTDPGAARYEPGPRAFTVLLDRRFGPAGLGLSRWPHRPAAAFRPDQLRAWSAAYFTTGNAALCLTGPPPRQLTLPLPTGRLVGHDDHFPARPAGPLWSAEWGAEPGIIMRTTRAAAWDVLGELLATRLARSGRVIAEFVDVDPLTRELILVVRPLAGRDAAAVEALWRELQQLASGGPSVRELAAAVHAKVSALDRPESRPHLEAVALEHLLNTPVRPDAVARTSLHAVTRHDIARVAAAGIGTALFVVPPGIRPELPGVGEDPCPRYRSPDGLPKDRNARDRAAYRRRPSRRGPLSQPADDRLIMAGDAVSAVDATGSGHSIRLPDAVLLAADGDTRVIANAERCVITVDPAIHPGAETIVAAIDRHRLRGGTGR